MNIFSRTPSATGSFLIFPVILLSIGWNVPKFFEMSTCYVQQNKSLSHEKNLTDDSIFVADVCVTDLRDNYSYCRDYILIANFLMMALVPFLLIAIFNILTFRKIYLCSLSSKRTTSRQERDQAIAIMLSTIVLVFLLCSVPRIIINSWEVKAL